MLETQLLDAMKQALLRTQILHVTEEALAHRMIGSELKTT